MRNGSMTSRAYEQHFHEARLDPLECSQATICKGAGTCTVWRYGKSLAKKEEDKKEKKEGKGEPGQLEFGLSSGTHQGTSGHKCTACCMPSSWRSCSAPPYRSRLVL